MNKNSNESFLERTFHLKQNGTTVKTEILAGITTFMTMAYILAVNPTMLAESGMDQGAVFTATALAACLATILMALFSNYPFVLAPGMGLNAYFVYTVCFSMGYSWKLALTAVFVEGIIFIVLSLTNVREAIFNSIPMTLKHAVSAGIGLFITFIGLQNAGIVQSNPSTLVSFIAFNDESIDMKSAGMAALLALVGVLITAILLVKKVKGGILWGILSTWILGMVCQGIGLYVPNPDAGWYSLFPDFSGGLSIPSLAPTLMKLDFSNILSLDFVVIVFAFLFVDLFDTLGTLIGVASKANMLNKDGKLPKIKGALMADAVGTTAGAVLGTSTVTTFVESASGVAEGGRTGLTAWTSAILFGLALFLSPIFLAIPSFATAPALILVGFLMMGSILNIDFDDLTEAIPAFICLMAMPFTYSISEGIAFGIISYVIINVATGKVKEKKIPVLMYILSVMFIAKYIFL